MKEFDESKHKRDELGRFAKMSARKIADEISYEVDDNTYFYFANKKGKLKKTALTDKEWELWYENQNNQGKNFLLNKLSLRRFVIVGNKCILTNGTYVKPRIEMVAEFRNEDLLIEFKTKADKFYE